MRHIPGDTHDLRLINLAGALAEEGITTLTLTPTPPTSTPSTPPAPSPAPSPAPITLAARTCNLAQVLRDLGPCTLTGSGPASNARANISPASISLHIAPKSTTTPPNS